MTQRTPKKSEKPLICFLRLYGTAKRRMEQLCKRQSRFHNDVAMAGTLTEMLRLEVQADEFDPELARASAEVRRLGGDPIAALRATVTDLGRRHHQTGSTP